VEKEGPTQSQARRENLAQLVAAASDYRVSEQKPTLADFLDNVSLLTDLDTVKAEAPCVLMTLHSAKGLEFDSVFLTGMEEGLFPHTLSIGSQRSIEEERRLCYVGMTRARNQLTLTSARSRKSALQELDRVPSRFLDEIPPELLDWDPEPGRHAPARPGRLRPGARVRHPLFGEGTVLEVEAGGGDEKLTVVFSSAGRKKLKARYAHLEILAKPRARSLQ
jgi:DNA helicase-2/ATP-dependent DNA helicase PcrA